jgi:hypothetical protein
MTTFLASSFTSSYSTSKDVNISWISSFISPTAHSANSSLFFVFVHSTLVFVAFHQSVRSLHTSKVGKLLHDSRMMCYVFKTRQANNLLLILLLKFNELTSTLAWHSLHYFFFQEMRKCKKKSLRDIPYLFYNGFDGAHHQNLQQIKSNNKHTWLNIQ